jgi:O-antigen/teichoic acid export membrane protein
MLTFSNKIIKEQLVAIWLLFLSFLANFFVSLLFSNFLGSADFGDYKLAITVLQLCSTVALLGSNQSIYEFLPHYVNQGAWDKAKGFILRHFKLLTKFSIAFILVSIVMLTLLMFSSENSIFQHRFYHPAIIVVWLAPFLGALMFVSSIIRSFGYNTKAMLPTVLVPVLTLAITLGLMLVVKPITMLHSFLIYSIALLLTLLYQIIFAYKTIPRSIWAQSASYQTQQWQEASYKLLLLTLAFISMECMELIILNTLAPSSLDVGLYSAILVLCSLVFLIRQAASLVISPLINPLIKENKLAELEKLVRQLNTVITVLTIVSGLLMAIFAKFLLHLFGAEYTSSYLALYIMLFTTVFGSSCSLSFEVLMFSSHQNTLIKINFIACIITFLLCIILIPTYGVIGAAIAFFISRVIVVISSIVSCRKLVGIKSYFII